MRIIINMDGIHEGGKRLRIRTRYNTTNRDGKLQLQARNVMVQLYNDLVEYIRKGSNPEVTDIVDEGEKA